MASIMQLYLCLVAVAIAMVTAAPVAKQEKLISTAGNDEVDRAKRAEEMVYFGNQQNKPRPPVKKSDPSIMLDLPKPDVPQGQEDLDGAIIAHEETPITADLEARVEAAAESGNQQAKFDDAVESAMHEAVSSALDEPQDETSDSSQGSHEAVENSEESADNDDDEHEGAGEGADSSVTGNDEVENELEEAIASEGEGDGEDEASAENNTEDGSDASDQQSAQTPPNEHQDEVQDFLEQLRKQGDNENNLESSSEVEPNMNDYDKNMYQYMASSVYPEDEERYPNYPDLPIYYRRRRSSTRVRRNQPLAFRNSRHARRIKRDLFDGLGIPSVDIDDSYMPESDDYLPLTDKQVEYLYSRLLPYLAEAYAEDNNDEGNGYNSLDLDSLKPYSLLGELEPADEPSYQPEIPVYPERSYEDFEPSLQVDNKYPLEKRNMMDYYAAAPARKRYFFPFSNEPETHWGAFVPEKRDYDEAIHRLQRLAMALNDEPGPYYTNMLGEYKKK